MTLFSAAAFAQAPNTMNYQGRLADDAGNAISGAVEDVVFTIYDDTTAGATALWTETDTLSCDANGVFTIELGLEVPIPFEIFDGSKRWLGIKVGTDTEMSPRQLLSSVPYSMATAGPGVAFKVREPGNVFIDFEGATVHSMDSIKINIPAPGFVYVSTSATLQVNHTSGTISNIYYQLMKTDDDVSYGLFGTGLVSIPPGIPSGNQWIPISTDKVFVEDTPGEKTYYVVFYPASGYDAGDDVFDLNTTALYFPSNYGAVNNPGTKKLSPKSQGNENPEPGK